MAQLDSKVVLVRGATSGRDVAEMLRVNMLASGGKSCSEVVNIFTTPPALSPHHGLEGNLRLACQVKVLGDIEVTKYAGVFGEGNTPVLVSPETTQVYYYTLSAQILKHKKDRTVIEQT